MFIKVNYFDKQMTYSYVQTWYDNLVYETIHYLVYGTILSALRELIKLKEFFILVLSKIVEIFLDFLVLSKNRYMFWLKQLSSMIFVSPSTSWLGEPPSVVSPSVLKWKMWACSFRFVHHLLIRIV